jgi:hypothetical protein
MANYYIVKYDNEASGPFVAEGANLTWSGGVGFIVTVIDRGTTGLLYIALVSGVAPTNNQQITQNTTTADADTDAILIDYPAYFREDVAVAGTGDITWTGPALSVSHSFFFDGQTSNVVAGEILTFSGGAICEVITVESDAGATGELSVRFISNIDAGLPADNETFTGDIAGDGVVNGVVHPRSYTPYELHRLLQDLNDNGDISGDDDLSRVDPIASSKDTPQIVNLLGAINVNDTVVQHMYGGSISQASGATLYAGVDVQITSPNTDTQPILIANDAIITDYWKNALNPDSIAGRVRIMIKVRENDVDFDGKRIKGKLAEFGDNYFIGGTTLGLGVTALALFSSGDGNNNTAVATVAGAPYNSIVQTEGYQTIDYNNGNGPTPFAYKIDFGSANSLQTYERTKYIGRRGTAETLFGRNAIFFDGINLNFPYDGEANGPFLEDEIVVWGTVMTYNSQTTNLTLGEVVTFSGGSRGRLIYMDDQGATGTLIFDMDGNALPLAAETMTGLTSGGDGTLATVGTNTVAGTGLLCALDDQGTTGNLYLCKLTGLNPINNSEIYGATSLASCLVNGTPETRTINNQYWGIYTGSNHQTNFGLGLDATDGIVGDIFPNLLGVNQSPPNNQQGQVTGLKLGDTVTVYPWDGVSLDVNGNALPTYAEATLTTALVAGVSTTAVVSAIPDNTPASGFLRIQRDSDNNFDLVEYSSYSGLTYTLVGTAPSNAAIGNNVMRAFIDQEMIADGTASYTAVKGASNTSVAIRVSNGYTAAKNGPIKPYPTTAVFGANGFSVGATRTSDA